VIEPFRSRGASFQGLGFWGLPFLTQAAEAVKKYGSCGLAQTLRCAFSGVIASPRRPQRSASAEFFTPSLAWAEMERRFWAHKCPKLSFPRRERAIIKKTTLSHKTHRERADRCRRFHQPERPG